MLIRELIVRHVGTDGALHERGILVDQTQLPPGLRVHHDGDEPVAPVAGDLVLARTPAGTGLRDHVDPDLPVGATVVLLLGVEVAELPVGRVLAALAVAGLQVVEAAVVSGAPAAMVAVVATRTDELVAPQPYLAHHLEPGNHESPAALRRVLGEHTLEGLVQRARERALLAQVAEIRPRLAEVTAEREQFRADRLVYEAAARDLETARYEADAERKRMLLLVQDLRKEAETAHQEADAERKRMRALRGSTSFKVASRLARVSGAARRIIRRPRGGAARR